MSGTARALRARLAAPNILLVPGVTNALYARLAKVAGMEAVFITGAGVANESFGVPDLGITTLSEIAETARRIVAAVDIPVIADADTGYGGRLNVMRTVRELEQAGVAALILEDQREPKRCGHFDGKELVAPREMVERLVAARRARVNPDLMIFARTDAIAVEGLDGALARARLYVQAGADAIFVEAPRTREELAAIAPAVSAVPCVINVVEGGATPILPLAELEELGFSVALYANVALRVAARSVGDAFATLLRDGGSTSMTDRMLTWEDRQSLVNLTEWERISCEITAEAAGVVSDDILSSDPQRGPAANARATNRSRLSDEATTTGAK
jgi:2-methylisocitrate lyase-like PEP mutase family enzyme